MTKPTVGRKITHRSLPTTPKGKSLVLYFYPKDLTSGCTAEGLDFKALSASFSRAGAVIRGVSRDSAASHARFRAKHGFPFELVADEGSALCDAFDVIKQKSLYGRKYLGIERSTFLVDAQGRLVREWRKVRVAGHAAEVLAAVRELDAAPKKKVESGKAKVKAKNKTKSAARARSRA